MLPHRFTGDVWLGPRCAGASSIEYREHVGVASVITLPRPVEPVDEMKVITAQMKLFETRLVELDAILESGKPERVTDTPDELPAERMRRLVATKSEREREEAVRWASRVWPAAMVEVEGQAKQGRVSFRLNSVEFRRYATEYVPPGALPELVKLIRADGFTAVTIDGIQEVEIRW